MQTVSGQPIRDYLEKYVFGPLEIANSHATRANARSDPRPTI